jgi:hypothetical protein
MTADDGGGLDGDRGRFEHLDGGSKVECEWSLRRGAGGGDLDARDGDLDARVEDRRI